MKKRIFAIVMAVIMVTTLFIGAIPAMAADEGCVTIRIHYHRPEGDYEGWELWAWDEDKNYSVSGKLASDGSATQEPPYLLEKGDGEMVATITVPTGTMRIGYILRYGEWEAKDLDQDQFINITGILTGTVDVYVESGIPTCSPTARDDGTIPSFEALRDLNVKYNGNDQKFLVPGDDCTYGVVVTGASYEVDKKGQPFLKVLLSSEPEKAIDTDSFAIKGQNGIAANVTKVQRIGAAYYVFLDQELPLDKAFVITYDETDYGIKMPDYYSTNDFETKYTYTGNDLGQTYTKEKTTLKLWAPLAASVQVYLYKNGNPAEQEEPDEKLEMTAGEKGTWSIELKGDKNGVYYTYYVDNVSSQKECVDPYARAVGVNGRRGMIIDLASTNPDGWDTDKDPHYDDDITDAIIWELHVRDFSSAASSGIKKEWQGKYLGLTQTGTTNTYGQATGLDYVKNLGITHIHLLPVYDFGSVLEDKTDSNAFNWGYDPQNYNVPEGSYSTDPFNGEVRVKEFKQMVKALHDNGISVVMDVVYNHVADAGKFCMNNTVPNYFSRPSGGGSGCGNDTASERSMVRKYIVDSVNYWADEYHIDGFRFDLAGVLDTVTINEIVKTVHAKHPNVIFYGEGWAAGGVEFTKPGMTQGTMANAGKMPNFAFFSDTIRNTLKGGTFGGITAGYISGGGTGDLNACFKGMPSWCPTPAQSVNYISAHDNNTLYDHITLVKPEASYKEKTDITKLGVAFYMAAQGIPFMQAGEEMNRTKPATSEDANNGNAADGFFHNSYNAPDRVNSIQWDSLYDQPTVDLVNYYAGMIAFRKAHPALRMTDASQVNTRVSNLTNLPDKVLGYQINAKDIEGETAEGIVCIYNATDKATTVTLPEGEWNVCVNKNEAGVYALQKVSGTVDVEAVSAMILVKGNVEAKPGVDLNATEAASTNWIVVICVWAAVAVLSAAAVILLLKKK